MVGSCSLRRRNNGADFSISSSSGPQLPRKSCANVVGSFAGGTTYRDIRISAKLNDYHRLRRWVSKGSKVCVCVGGGGVSVCVCLCVCVCVCVYVCVCVCASWSGCLRYLLDGLVSANQLA